MAVERTLVMLKPVACRRGVMGAIISIYEENGFNILAQKQLHLSKKEAELFYAEHRERSFFNELTDFLSSGFVIAMVMEKENAIADNRELMGATDPKKAREGTIRHMYATNTQCNAVHGSDSAESAKREIHFFFSEMDIIRSL